MPSVDTAPMIGECHESKDTKDCFNQNLNQHIQSNLDIKKTLHASGKAYVQFKITADGQVQDVKVRAEDEKHREEAIRVIELLKIKRPATLNGENVAVLHSLPITFRTVNHNSMEEFLRSEDFQKNIEMNMRRQEKERVGYIKFEDLKFPPEFKECISTTKKEECFRTITNLKLLMQLQKKEVGLKSGTEIKYFFQIDKEGNVSNVIVNIPEKSANKIAREVLENLVFESPAIDEQRNPATTEFIGNLIL